MRVISTGNRNQVAIIAATVQELKKLKRLELTKEFNADISVEPKKSEQYQCFTMVYTFETSARAKVFRLAYAMARKNGKLKAIKRAKPHPPSYYKRLKNQHKMTVKRRKMQRARKREKRRYYRLLPIMRAGRISDLERKAREIARIGVISDLL